MNKYIKPEIEIINAKIEKGFAGSNTSNSNNKLESITFGGEYNENDFFSKFN